MRLLKNKYIWVVTTIVLAIGYVVSCTKDNQVLDVPVVDTGTDLISIKVTTPPTIDGTIDAVWNSATKLNVTPTVPDPGNALFTGYIGTQYPASVRSLYDDQNIYFLAEWNDATKNSQMLLHGILIPLRSVGPRNRAARTFDASGNLTREGWGEDKLAMLWNIDFSTPKFISQTCYASCHVFTSLYRLFSIAARFSTQIHASGNHYTNGPNEKIDMWWARLGYVVSDCLFKFYG